MRNIIIVFLSMFVSNAFALAFHYDNVSVELTTVKHTSPALHIRDNGILYYGALFSVNDYTVPPNVVHVRQPDGSEYFLAPWCDAGQYPSPETNECIPCGYGHYCTGGHHRESCTYGIISCNTTNNTYDPPMPSGTDGMYNRALTMAEVNQYVPITDISLYNRLDNHYVWLNCGPNPNDEQLTNYTYTLQKGTYLLAHRYPKPGETNAVNGLNNTIGTAYVVVFNHSVSYRPINMCNYFGHYFDTLHVPWQEYDLKIPSNYYGSNENITNINNVSQVIDDSLNSTLYIYQLK